MMCKCGDMADGLGEKPIADLPVPDMFSWQIFPFEGDFSVRTVLPFNEHDRPRSGEPEGGPCHCESAETERPLVWSNNRWEVRPIEFGPGHAAPVPAYMLQTKAHMDIEDFDEQYAAELGVMTIRMERAIKATGSIGRVHFNRWGDGGSHFHVWFLGRPLGAWQLSGFALPLWGFILPSLDESVRAKNDELVRASLDAQAANAG